MRQPTPTDSFGRSIRTPAVARSRAAAKPIAAVLVGILALGGLSACAATATDASSLSAAQAATLVGSDFYDTSLVHSITIDFDEDEYQEILEAYSATGDKDWISATVTIDGTVFEEVGLRLKGNSSLRGVGNDTTATDESGDGSASSDEPETLPWLIRLDKYVDDQSYEDRTEFVVRGNTTQSSLNEAVALELIGLSGLVTERSAAVRLSVNGGDEALRLVMESIDDDLWNDDTFVNDGITYKADSTGDYSYRGADPADYDDIFNQKTGDDDLTPLISFLDFINNADDATFSAELGDYLDVDAFATYLAMEDLTVNNDDIDGRGNNSYLRYDSVTELMTVVAWDANLSFGATNGGAEGLGAGRGGGGQAPGGQAGGDRPALPDGAVPGDAGAVPGAAPEGAVADGAVPDAAGGQLGGGMDGNNILATRFLADSTFSALTESATATLTTSLYDSGDAQAVLDHWTTLLDEQASDLISTDALQSESDAIAVYLTAAD